MRAIAASLALCGLLVAASAWAACGDGIVQPGERCDDGNTTGGDGCSASCVTECALGPRCLCVRTLEGPRSLCLFANPGCILGTPLDLPSCNARARQRLERLRRRALKAASTAEALVAAGRVGAARFALARAYVAWPLSGAAGDGSPACRAEVRAEATLLRYTDVAAGFAGPCYFGLTSATPQS